MRRVVILNGPPGCGKDTIGAFAADDWGFATLSFKQPMYAIAAATIGMPLEEFMQNYNNREWKEQKHAGWDNKSVRDLMIAVSESFVKPFYGNDYFGRNVAFQINSMAPFVRDYIITDGGFYSEVDALVKEGIDVYIVHMFREGCTFEGDSRNYIVHPETTMMELYNNGTIEETLHELTRMLKTHGLPVSYGDNSPIL